jgi:hypothetical protein
MTPNDPIGESAFHDASLNHRPGRELGLVGCAGAKSGVIRIARTTAATAATKRTQSNPIKANEKPRFQAGNEEICDPRRSAGDETNPLTAFGRT